MGLTGLTFAQDQRKKLLEKRKSVAELPISSVKATDFESDRKQFATPSNRSAEDQVSKKSIALTKQPTEKMVRTPSINTQVLQIPPCFLQGLTFPQQKRPITDRVNLHKSDLPSSRSKMFRSDDSDLKKCKRSFRLRSIKTNMSTY